MNRTLRNVALPALALLALAPATQASILLGAPSITPDTGGFRFSYNATFVGLNTAGATITLEPGDFFTIYDFTGLVPGTNLQPGDWAFSSTLTGADPFGFTPPDDPAVPNLTWTYTGASRIANGALGAFSAVSLLGGTRSDLFAAQNTQTLTGVGSFPASNGFFVPVPAAAAIPEPGSLVLLAGGTMAGLLARRRRR